MQTDLKKCLKLNPKHAMANGMFSIHAERPLNKSFLPFPPKDPHKLAAIEEIRLAFSNIQIQKSSSRKTAGPQLKCSEYNMSLKTLLPNPGFAKGKNK